MRNYDISFWNLKKIKQIFCCCCLLLFLFQLIFSVDSFPRTYAAWTVPNEPVINNLNDWATTSDSTPDFNFDLADNDAGDTLLYEVEVDEAGGNFSTPVLSEAEIGRTENFFALDGGNYFSIALKPDGTVWTWGNNAYGQLGDGTTTLKKSPVQISTLSGAIAVAAGDNHAIALVNDGSVWTWGYNYYGQLGNGNTNNSSVPLEVTSLTGTVVAVGGGTSHTVVLKADGTVWAWGYNANGQLGNGTTINSNLPVQVSNLTGATAISVGDHHSFALKSDGTLWGWGHNGYGRLGIDSVTAYVSTPQQLSDLTDVVAVSAGGGHTVALKENGSVWAWGDNRFGNVGAGITTSTILAPVAVLNLTKVVSISAGGEHSIATRSDGTVWAWGDNNYSQLGDSTVNDRFVPVPVQVSNLSGAIVTSVGGWHSFAIQADGTVWGWGANNYGQLGDGSTTLRNTPVNLGFSVAQPNPVLGKTAPRTGVTHTLSSALSDGDYIWRVRAIDQDENVGGWAVASTGFTVGTIGQAPDTPVLDNYYSGEIVQTDNLTLQFDLSDPDWDKLNYRIQVDDDADFSSPLVDYLHTILASSPLNDETYFLEYLKEGKYYWRVKAIDENSLASDWATAVGGFNITFNQAPNAPVLNNYNSGEVIQEGKPTFNFNLADSDTSDNLIYKIEVEEKGGDFSTPVLSAIEWRTNTSYHSLDAGSYHSTAIANDGTVWSWGYNFRGQLGNGNNTNTNYAVQVSTLSGAIAVTGNKNNSFALLDDGSVWGWGASPLGDGTSNHSNIPVKVFTGATAIARGVSQTLALRADGTIWNWGNEPTQVHTLSGAVALAAGQHNLVLRDDGTVWSWGQNNYGELGDGTNTFSSDLVQVVNLTDVIAIAAGERHSLALKSDGTVWVWGYNYYGQLGDGSNNHSNTPIQVLSEVSAIETGEYHSLAIKSDGTLWAWGLNLYGQLGDGTTDNSNVPLRAVGVAGVTKVAGGYGHTLALKNKMIIPKAHLCYTVDDLIYLLCRKKQEKIRAILF